MKTRYFMLLFILATLLLTGWADKEAETVTNKDGINTQYISKDFVATAVVRPGNILKSKIVKMLSDNGIPVEKALKDFTNDSGINAGNVEQVIVLIDQKTLSDFPNSFTGRTFPGIGVIIRFSKAVDEAALAKKAHLQKRTVNGKTFYDAPDGEIATAYFVDNKTVLFATNGLLPKMMAAKNVSSPLTKLLSTAKSDEDLLVVLPMKSIENLIAMGLQGAPPPVANNAELIRSVENLVLAANLTGDSFLNLRFDMNQTDSAKNLTALIQKGLGKAKEELTKFKADPRAIPIPMFGEMFATIEELVNGVTAKQNEKQVVINVKSISVERLYTQLKPAIAKAREAAKREAKRAARKNDLKQIAIAFHNHHDAFGSMPNATGAGTGTGAKLSWRVHLLPFLEQQALYKQFLLKEPWDSKHNKALINKMPKIFEIPGQKNDGKTNIHVFTGKGTPFNGPKPVRFQDITDGTSNTIMCVIAGKDKADFWTKPGGLKFDPKKNPFEAIGKLDGTGVLAALMDGSIRTIIKTIDARSMRKLIQHADGNVID